MSRMDLGVEGITDTTLICTLTTSTKFSRELIKKHSQGLREGLGEYYYVGTIKFVDGISNCGEVYIDR